MVPKFRQSVFVLIVMLLSSLVVNYDLIPTNRTVAAQSLKKSLSQAPDASATPIDIVASTASITAGVPVKFTAIFSGPPQGLTFTWIFGDNTRAQTTTVPTILHTYAEEGFVTVEVIISGLGPRSKRFKVNPPIAPEDPIEPIESVTIRPSIQGEDKIYKVLPNINFRVAAEIDAGTPPFTYQWFLDNSPLNASANEASIDLSLSEPDSYTVRVIVNNEANEPAVDEIRIDVLPESITGLRLLPPLTIIEKQPVEFQASIVTGTDVQFFFNYGNGDTSLNFSSPTRSKSYSAPPPWPTYIWQANLAENEYEVIVQATIGDQAIVEHSKCIVVQPEPIQNLRISTIGHSAAITKTIDFSAFMKKGRVTNYRWSGKRVDNARPSGQGSPDVLSTYSEDKMSHAFKIPGVYLIRLEAKGPEFTTKCSGTKKQPNLQTAYTVATIGVAQAATNVTLLADNKPVATSDNIEFSVEFQKEITYTVKGLGNDTDPSMKYEWDFGDGTKPETGGVTMKHIYRNTTDEPHILQVKPLSGDTSIAFYALVSVTGPKLFLPIALQTIDTIRQGNPAPTAISTNTPIPFPSNTPRPTSTPIYRATSTDTPLPTNTPEPTATPIPPTPIPVDTATPTSTHTNTPIPTITPLSTSTPTATITPIPTSTQAP